MGEGYCEGPILRTVYYLTTPDCLPGYSVTTSRHAFERPPCKRCVRRSSLNIAAQNFYQFVCRLGFGGIGFRIGAQDMKLYFALHDLGHQAVHRSTTRGHLLKDCSAFPVFRHCVLDAFKLPLNAVDAGDQLFLIGGDVTQCERPRRSGIGCCVHKSCLEDRYTLDGIVPVCSHVGPWISRTSTLSTSGKRLE